MYRSIQPLQSENFDNFTQVIPDGMQAFGLWVGQKGESGTSQSLLLLVAYAFAQS
jgi:hypothetical protein